MFESFLLYHDKHGGGPSFAFPAFPAAFAAIGCVVEALFIVQEEEKAPLEAGKPSQERIGGSVAAISPNNLEQIQP